MAGRSMRCPCLGHLRFEHPDQPGPPMSEHSKGTAVAITEAVDSWDHENREADEEELQYGLFGTPQTEAGRQKLVGYRRGPGRPPGSRNRRTEQTVAFLLSRHRDPRQILMEIAEANPADLAALLGCSLHDALIEKRLAAIGVLPYVAAKITPETIDNRQIIHLHIGTTAETGGAADGGQVHVLSPDDYQHVSDEPTDEPASEQ
jgi:hypothetical protein